MAKELPYFKFEPSEWLEGEIQIISDKSISCFINLCSGYWLKLGAMKYAFALHKYCRKDASILKELIDNNIIKKVGDNIEISFLDNQLKEFKGISKERSKAANIRWEKERKNANAMQVQSKSNAIREEKSKEDKSKENKNNIYLKELLNSQSWLETTSMQTKQKFNVNQVKKFLELFNNYLQSTFEYKKNKKEYATHFINWLKSQEKTKINSNKPVF